jgi:hypothetical protein
MLQEVLIPQLDEDDQEGRIHFQQDGAPPHYLGEVRASFPGSYSHGFHGVAKLFLKHPEYCDVYSPYLTTG